MPRCTFTPAGDGLASASPYDPAFVAAFKAAVPPAARRWDAASKRWLISLRDWIAASGGELPDGVEIAPAREAFDVKGA